MKRLSIFFAALTMCAFSFAAEVNITSFTSLSGTIGAGITYSTAQGGAGTAPAVNNGQIRLYQASSGNAGGRLVIKAPKDVTITQVSLTSTMATNIGYIVGVENTDASTTVETFMANGNSATIVANGTFTAQNLDCSVITFACLGTDKNSRIYVSSIKVTYKTPCQGYAITLSTHPEDAGSVSSDVSTACEGEIVTLTAVASEDYVFTGWSAMDGEANEVTITDGKFAMPASNVEVEGTFRAKEIYTIDWFANSKDVEGTPTISVKEGEKVSVLPKEPSSCEKGKVFVGWTDAEITDGSLPEVLFSNVKDAPIVNHNTTYYAVFAQQNETGGTTYTYEKLQATDGVYSISNGDYLLVAQPQGKPSYAYAGKVEDKNYGGYVEVDVNKGVITNKPETAVELTITITDETEGKFSIYDGTYWWSAPNKNEIQYNSAETDGKDAWVISEKYGSINSVSQSKRWIQFNSTSGQERFATYTGSQTYAYLYKKTAHSEISYSNYTTSLNCIPTGVKSNAAQTSMIKSIENGQLVITIDGTRYNAQGQVIE